MLTKLIKGGQWANLIILLGHILGDVTGMFPAAPWTPTVLKIQALIGILLPSVGGIGHKIAFAEPQDPALRKKEKS